MPQAGFEPAIPSKGSATDPLLRALCHRDRLNLPYQCHFARLKSHTDWTAIELRTLQWGAGDANRLSHSTALNFCSQTVKRRMCQDFPPKYLVPYGMLFRLLLISEINNRVPPYAGFNLALYRGADKSLARPDWKNNWKVPIFRPTRRSLLPRRPGWTDNGLDFFLSGLQKLEFWSL